MKYGYVRKSTEKQSNENQMDMLKNYGVDRLYIETASGASNNRPKLQEMLEILQPNDIVVITELSRMSRSIIDLINTVNAIKEKGAHIKSLREGEVDTTTATGNLLFNLTGILAQFERELISERTKNALAVARTSGRIGGRPRVSKDKEELALELYKTNRPVSEVLRMAGISKQSFYNALYYRIDTLLLQGETQENIIEMVGCRDKEMVVKRAEKYGL